MVYSDDCRLAAHTESVGGVLITERWTQERARRNARASLLAMRQFRHAAEAAGYPLVPALQAGARTADGPRTRTLIAEDETGEPDLLRGGE